MMTTDTAFDILLARALPRRIMNVIAAHGGEARLVGGVVRDILNGGDPLAATDFDMAVNQLPADAQQWLEDDGLRVIPTGIDHGTVTVVDEADPTVRAEVTSLRVDIQTDGRHARVRFGTDWYEDAKRRDFTINAMYLDRSGSLFDPFNGCKDLINQKVRFVGNASARIKEDYLRMLRFFRFHARFGGKIPDSDAMKAISNDVTGLKKISGERIAQELRGLFSVSNNGSGQESALKAMVETGIDHMISPKGFRTEGYDRLNPILSELEPMLCLGYLISVPQDDPVQDHVLTSVTARLRLSRREAWVLARSVASVDHAALSDHHWARTAYDMTRDASLTPMVLAGLYAISSVRDNAFSKDIFDRIKSWLRPVLPITGEDLINHGVTPGKTMGQLLSSLEDYWKENDFTPDHDMLSKRLIKMLDDFRTNG